MFVKIDHVNSFNKAIRYNEKKVSGGQAALLDAGGFLKGSQDLSLEEKIDRFQMRMDMNILARKHGIHMSLNFSPDDQLPDRKLKAIAAAYLKLIGFRYQPYLLYRHDDAGHPHLHLITTKIRSDGIWICLFRKAGSALKPAMQKIVKDFGLVIGQGRKPVLNTLSPTAANYGKIPTNQAIRNVLNQTLDSYHYTSVQELNAVLSIYNVKAYVKHNPQHQHQIWGVWYYVLDENGRCVSVPIASKRLCENAGWKNLCQRFESNAGLRNSGKSRIKNEVDVILAAGNLSLSQFVSQLEEKGIRPVYRKQSITGVYALTYVDFQTKSVFDARDLGPRYSAGHIAACCRLQTAAGQDLKTDQKSGQHLAGGDFESVSIALNGSPSGLSDANAKKEADFLFDLFRRVHDHSNNDLLKKKKMKKRRKIS